MCDSEMFAISIKEVRNGIRVNPSINQHLPDILGTPKLSLKAKCLFLMMLAQEDFFAHPTSDKEGHLYKSCKEGAESIRTGIKELQKAGLLQKRIIKGKGRVIGSSWLLYPFSFGGV